MSYTKPVEQACRSSRWRLIYRRLNSESGPHTVNAAIQNTGKALGAEQTSLLMGSRAAVPIRGEPSRLARAPGRFFRSVDKGSPLFVFATAFPTI